MTAQGGENPVAPLPREARLLALLLAGVGCLDACAVIAVFAPRKWLAAAHAWLGLGVLPEGVIVDYLMRTASAMYAVFGLFMVVLSQDVKRHWRLIGVLIWIAFFHGAIVIGIGVAAGLPAWWPVVEGCGYFLPAAAMFVLYRRASPSMQP